MLIYFTSFKYQYILFSPNPGGETPWLGMKNGKMIGMKVSFFIFFLILNVKFK